MPAPSVTPERLGLPCWPADSVDQTIRSIAQVDREHRHRFLACHAPIAHIRDERTGKHQTDDHIFARLARLGQQENLVLVWGEPGTGKSHLINWLKLRFDHARSAGEMADVLPVLIQRRSGSLKDALEQLVGQLPDRFQSYLDPVRSAISRISEAEARQKLANALHLELGVRWQQRGKAPMHRHVRDLPTIFHSEGFAGWLCRPGGVIDRNIQRLVSPSDVTDRDSIPEFSAEEFLITERRYGELAVNTQKAYALHQTFLDEPELAEEAASLCNSVLRDALREVTGLGNAQLSQVFRQIRKDLKADRLRLALFIEDVSTLSVLDDEVVNALEPQSDTSLCPLTAVLGMTDVAYKRLRDSNIQRPSLILALGGSNDAGWRAEPSSLDRFAARYLNTIRLRESDLWALAEERQEGADVTRSACSGCGRREECHAAFGSVEFEGVQVGLFPFVPGTAARLLGALDERAAGVRRTQRGLLEHLVRPILEHVEALAEGRTAAPALALQRQEPTYWLTFRETYAGGWQASEIARLRFLSEFWTPATTAQDVASDLKPLLSPFRLPELTRADASAFRRSPEPRISPVPQPQSAAPQSLDPRIVDLSKRLDRWLAGEDFDTPGDAQDLVLKFLKGALPLEDRRSPSAAVRTLLSEGKRSLIRFPGSKTGGTNVTFKLELPRSEETRDLILALARQEHVGKGSWAFDQGQRYKRVVARWLRANTDWICAALDPEGLDTSIPVQQAVQFLGLAAVVQRRAALPTDTVSAVAAVMAPPGTKPLASLNDKLQRLWNDLPERQRKVRDFLLAEIDVPQGTGGCVMVDPWPVIAAMGRGMEPEVPRIEAAYLDGHWKSRYTGLDTLKAWAELPALLEEERGLIEEHVLAIKQHLRAMGYDVTDAPQALLEFFAEIAELVMVQAETRQLVPNGPFEQVRDSLVKRKVSLAAALRVGEEVASASKLSSVLTFDPRVLAELRGIVAVCVAYIEKVREHVDSKLDFIASTGDPDVAMKNLLSAISRVTVLRQPQTAMGNSDV